MVNAPSSLSTISKEFWRRNFIQSFAEKNVPIKTILSRKYMGFFEEFIHKVEGRFRPTTLPSAMQSLFSAFWSKWISGFIELYPKCSGRNIN